MRNIRADYPYQSDDGRERVDSTSPRVLRGGAFYDLERFVRCASRSDSNPYYRLVNVGFRVVVVPF